MKLSNFQVMNPQFVPALEKLLKREMPVSTCAELAECLTGIEEKTKILQKTRTALIDKYLMKDEKGQPIVENNAPKFINEEAKGKFLIEVNELLKGDFEVSFNSKVELKESDIMSPQEYMLMKDFVKIVKKVNAPIDSAKK